MLSPSEKVQKFEKKWNDTGIYGISNIKLYRIRCINLDKL